jgi:hypothetical protein
LIDARQLVGLRDVGARPSKLRARS